LKNLYPALEKTLILRYKMDRLMLHRVPLDVDSENVDPGGSSAKDKGLLPLDFLGTAGSNPAGGMDIFLL
jgi:hypothetical protein